MLFVCFWPINRHVFVFERPSTLNYIPTLWGSKRWYLRERTQSKILRGWKTRFFLREGSGDEENIHILLWYLEKWCVCIYKYHETPFSMKSKIFGHLKPRLLTIKTSKKCRFGGPMLYIYIYINIIIHKQYPWFYMYQSVFLRDRNLPPPEFHPFFQLTSGSSIHDDQAAFLL